MKRKIVKYIISRNESFDLVPFGTIILNAEIIVEEQDDNQETSLLYFPAKRKYSCNGTIIELGGKDNCDCISFAKIATYKDLKALSKLNKDIEKIIFDPYDNGKHYIKSDRPFINLPKNNIFSKRKLKL